jgi:sugar/nucleoside kinase (ribokinase family)
MKARAGILAGGNWITDQVKVVDSWPPQDALATILAQTSGNGGAPYNVLKDLAKLGAAFPLAGIGLVGDDENGRAIRADCAAHRIDTAQLRIVPGAATSYTDVMTEQGTGRRTFFHRRGANALLAPGHFDFSATQAKIFHLGYLLLLDELDEFDASGRPRSCAVLAAAQRAGLKTSVDVVSESSERFGRVVLPALAHADYCFVNDFEAERLTGIPLRRNGVLDSAAVIRAAQKLIEAGVGEWVFIHAAEAAYACPATGEGHWQPSVKIAPTDIQGAAGAGDAFAAGVLLGLHEGQAVTDCLRLGVCAGAAALFHVTCSEGVRPEAGCLALGAKFGYRPLPG